MSIRSSPSQKLSGNSPGRQCDCEVGLARQEAFTPQPQPHTSLGIVLCVPSRLITASKEEKNWASESHETSQACGFWVSNIKEASLETIYKRNKSKFVPNPRWTREVHPAGGNVYFRCEDTIIVQSGGTGPRQHSPEKSVNLVYFTLSERLAKGVLDVSAYTTFIKDCLSKEAYDDVDSLEIGLSPRTTTSKRERSSLPSGSEMEVMGYVLDPKQLKFVVHTGINLEDHYLLGPTAERVSDDIIDRILTIEAYEHLKLFPAGAIERKQVNEAILDLVSALAEACRDRSSEAQRGLINDRLRVIERLQQLSSGNGLQSNRGGEMLRYTVGKLISAWVPPYFLQILNTVPKKASLRSAKLKETAYTLKHEHVQAHSIAFYVCNPLLFGLPSVRIQQLNKIIGPERRIHGTDWRAFHSQFETDWSRASVLAAILFPANVGLIAIPGLEGHYRSATVIASLISMLFALTSISSTMMLSLSIGSRQTTDDRVREAVGIMKDLTLPAVSVRDSFAVISSVPQATVAWAIISFAASTFFLMFFTSDAMGGLRVVYFTALGLVGLLLFVSIFVCFKPYYRYTVRLAKKL